MSQHIHFIGIGGIGTSGLAQVLKNKGYKISGSDIGDSEILQNLEKSGMKIFKTQKEDNISSSIDLVVYSVAISESNSELKQAKKLNIPCVTYPQALGDLSKEYFTIAIAGTHGKSTTTAMTSLIATAGGLDPTVIIGTKLKEFENQNFRTGESKFLIVEACEYKRSFLNIQPKILIITNIEAEHLDYYKNLADYKKAFEELVEKVPNDGIIIIDSEDENSREVVKNAKAQVIAWSAEGNLQIKPGIPGKFNVKNANFAAIVGSILGITQETIRTSIENYKGSWRRLEHKFKIGKTEFIDDYAHHPTEIHVTLNAIRETHPDAKMLCVFQPHQHSRTKALLKEFGPAFHAVDKVIIPNIYKVRDSEEDVKSVTTDDLVKEIQKHGTKAKNTHNFEETIDFIEKNYIMYDLIVTMGAGDINKLYENITLNLRP